MSEASGTSVPTLAVTGSTGRLGGRVARRLAVRGVPQTLLVRSPERAPRLPGAVAVRAEYADRNAVRDALTGTRTVFMVSASESADRLARHRAFVDAVAEAGVRHLVYVSFYGAAPDAAFTLARDHFHTEQHIRASGLAYTFLRDNLYAEFVPDLVGEDGVIRGPAGNGRAAFVGQDDIADAAAAVLLRPDDHAGATYDLTGPSPSPWTRRPPSCPSGSGAPSPTSRRRWRRPTPPVPPSTLRRGSWTRGCPRTRPSRPASSTESATRFPASPATPPHPSPTSSAARETDGTRRPDMDPSMSAFDHRKALFEPVISPSAT